MSSSIIGLGQQGLVNDQCSAVKRSVDMIADGIQMFIISLDGRKGITP